MAQSKTEREVAAALEVLAAGGALTLWFDAMGSTTFFLRDAAGVETQLPKRVGQMMPLMRLRLLESDRGHQVFEAR